MNLQAHQVAYLVRRQVAVGMTSISGSARRAPARRVGTTRANGAQGRRSRLALTHALNRHPVTAPPGHSSGPGRCRPARGNQASKTTLSPHFWWPEWRPKMGG